jgi:hypothetical protein
MLLLRIVLAELLIRGSRDAGKAKGWKSPIVKDRLCELSGVLIAVRRCDAVLLI